MIDLFCHLHDLWIRFTSLRYLIVGGWNFVFGNLAFVVCYWLLNSKIENWLIVLISSVLGITNSFVFHRWLTFHSKGDLVFEYLKFYLVYGVQVVLMMVAIHVFVTCMALNAYVVSFVGNILLTIITYWVHKNFSFNHTGGNKR